MKNQVFKLTHRETAPVITLGISKRARDLLQEVAKQLVLLPLAVLFMFPLLWMLSTSLKPDRQILAYPPVWIPHPIE